MEGLLKQSCLLFGVHVTDASQGVIADCHSACRVASKADMPLDSVQKPRPSHSSSFLSACRHAEPSIPPPGAHQVFDPPTAASESTSDLEAYSRHKAADKVPGSHSKKPTDTGIDRRPSSLRINESSFFCVSARSNQSPQLQVTRNTSFKKHQDTSG
jgi:hypothetical protein